MLQIDMLILWLVFCDFDTAGRAGSDVGTTTGTVIEVDFRAGKTADSQLE